ncbi:hypothetical protein BDY24DRAFT_395692 [Mrakia frigida]|uniref:zinc finger MYND domain-containing protein n=1 Tax=Mrakia frigida TaxID=29902 RepID=UPI003FCC0752
MPWSSCSGTEKDGRDCAKLKVGEEMYACGGCKTIRYCSREHQRADWKRHKPLCMVALWE